MVTDKLKRGTQPAAGGGIDKTYGLFTTSFLSSSYDKGYPASGSQLEAVPVTDAALKLSTFTIEIWYKFGTVQNFFWPILMYPRTDGYRTADFQLTENLSTNQGRILVNYTSPGPTQRQILGTFTLSPGSWCQAVFSYTNGTQKIYANNVLLATNSFTSPPQYGSDVGVELNNNAESSGKTSGSYSGTMRRVKIYNVAWSATDVSTAYTAGVPTI